MKTIMIIGASGFIGKHLTKYYLDQNNLVIAFVPNPIKMVELSNRYTNLIVIKASYDDFNNIASKVNINCTPDVFYYLAWDGYGKSTNDYVAQTNNIKPVCDAVVEAKKIGCKRFLFTSSLSEYMVKEGSNLKHDDDATCNVYGSAKHAARILAQAVAAQQDLPFISIAFANTFGPGDFSLRSTNLFIYQLLNQKDINLTEGNHMYDWNYIDDALEGLILAGEKGKPDSFYYIGNRMRRPLKEIVFEVRDILSPKSTINLGKYHDDFYMDYSCIDVHKLYRDTGYLAKKDFKEAILSTATWVSSQKWE